MHDLFVVDEVEQRCGDDAADEVAEHEEQHPLPTPHGDFSCAEKWSRVKSGGH